MTSRVFPASTAVPALAISCSAAASDTVTYRAAKASAVFTPARSRMASHPATARSSTASSA